MRIHAVPPALLPTPLAVVKAGSNFSPALPAKQSPSVTDTFTFSASKAENRSGLNTSADLSYLEKFIPKILGYFETDLQSLASKRIEVEGKNVLTVPLTINDRLGKPFNYELGKGKSWDDSPHYYLDVWESDGEKNRIFESHKPIKMIGRNQLKTTNTVQTMGGINDYYQLLRQQNPQLGIFPLEVTTNAGVVNHRMSGEQLSQHQEAVNSFFNETFTRISNLMTNFG